QSRHHRRRRHQPHEGLSRVQTLAVLAVFLPLAAAIVAGLFGRWLGDRGAQLVTCAALCLSALSNMVGFYEVAILGHGAVVDLFTWIDTGELQVHWALRLDSLSAVMLLVVSLVSAMVHIYSIGYMAHDNSIPRFMAYLSFFTFFMLALVTSDNFVQLFFG